jgi:NAD(P)-dependent dehydrogenase (short-subunit alcohol dehydrogenase family)
VARDSALDAERVRTLAPSSLFSLVGRVAVVTGAAGGIGRWLAAGLGAAGAAVLLTDVDEAGLEEVRADLVDAGVETADVAVDLAAEDAPDRIVSAARERFGGLHVLVNNAAVNRRMPILEMDPVTWDLITRIDLKVPYFLSQRAAGAMIEQGAGGAIVNIGSLNSAYALEQISVYGPAKAGLSQLTRVMALEWAPHGIRANAIAPGFMDTPLAAPIWANEDIHRWILNRVPLERPGRPDELVGACLLLASEAGSFLTGQTLYVDGGALAGGRWFTPDR